MMHPLQLKVAWWLPVAAVAWAWIQTVAVPPGFRWATIGIAAAVGIYCGRWIDRENRG